MPLTFALFVGSLLGASGCFLAHEPPAAETAAARGEAPGLSLLASPSTVAAGWEHTCALRPEGRVACWGINVRGHLGVGVSGLSTPDRPRATESVAGLDDVVHLTAGGDFTCALRRDGTVWCWGAGPNGERGDGTRRLSSGDAARVVGLDDVVNVEAGWGHACAIRSDRSLWCWGRNGDGQLGYGGEEDGAAEAVRVMGVEALDVVATGSGTCALTGPRTVRCWGLPFERAAAAPELRTVEDVVELTGGRGSLACARLADGSNICWGEEYRENLGDGPETPEEEPMDPMEPIEILGVGATLRVTPDGNHTCAVTPDGGLYCWGSNLCGQTNPGSEFAYPTPVPVPGVDAVVEVALGSSHTCVRRDDDSIWCWGDDRRGQLGDGAPAPATSPCLSRSTPSQVVGL